MRTSQTSLLSSVAWPPGLSLRHLHWLLPTLPADNLIECLNPYSEQDVFMLRINFLPGGGPWTP